MAGAAGRAPKIPTSAEIVARNLISILPVCVNHVIRLSDPNYGFLDLAILYGAAITRRLTYFRGEGTHSSLETPSYPAQADGKDDNSPRKALS
jgi:hypothetical protein